MCSSDLLVAAAPPLFIMPIFCCGALPQREMGILKSEGAAAAIAGQYKKLPQRELVSIKNKGAAATRNGHYKKRGAAATRDRKSVV